MIFKAKIVFILLADCEEEDGDDEESLEIKR